MIADPGTDLLTRDEAAAVLRVKAQTLAAWASRGCYNLPLVKVGRRVCYRRADIERFITEQTVTPGLPATGASACGQ